MAEEHSGLEVAPKDPAELAPEVLAHDSPELIQDKDKWQRPVCASSFALLIDPTLPPLLTLP